MIDPTEALEHARSSPDREICGLILRVGDEEVYMPCRNVAEGKMEFKIHPEDWAEAEDRGTILEIIHSHPHGAPRPSEADLVECERWGLPWTIIALPSEKMYSFAPSGYRAPLIGRTYAFGVLDCWTLIRDWYAEEWGITLPDFEYSESEWKNGPSLHLKYAKTCGFTEISGRELRRGDVILFNLQSREPNHSGVYLGDMLFLHHLTKQPSGTDIFGGYWKLKATHYFRLEELS